MVALIPLLYSLYSVFVGSANGLRRFRAQAGFDIWFSTTKTVLLVGGAVVAGRGRRLAGWVADGAAHPGAVRGGDAPAPPGRGRSAFPMQPPADVHGRDRALHPADQPGAEPRHPAAAPVRGAGRGGGTGQRAERPVRGRPQLRAAALSGCCWSSPSSSSRWSSRSTFEQDREATRAYVTQTLRYAIILAGAVAARAGGAPGRPADAGLPGGVPRRRHGPAGPGGGHRLPVAAGRRRARSSMPRAGCGPRSC